MGGMNVGMQRCKWSLTILEHPCFSTLGDRHTQYYKLKRLQQAFEDLHNLIADMETNEWEAVDKWMVSPYSYTVVTGHCAVSFWGQYDVKLKQRCQEEKRVDREKGRKSQETLFVSDQSSYSLGSALTRPSMSDFTESFSTANKSFTLLLWYISTASLSRYSECAATLSHLTKLNTTSLCSGFFGFTASTLRPRQQPETCSVGLDLRRGSENTSVSTWPSFQTCASMEPGQNMDPEGRVHSGLWEVFLGVWESCIYIEYPYGYVRFDRLPDAMASHGSLFVRLSCGLQDPRHKQILSTRCITPLVSSCCHPWILKAHWLDLI